MYSIPTTTLSHAPFSTTTTHPPKPPLSSPPLPHLHRGALGWVMKQKGASSLAVGTAGVELKDVEEIDRPRPTSTRSLLTLKPLPKIDPKDKGKKKIEEEEESESKDDDIPQAVKKFKHLESDEELARKIQEDWEAEEERNKIAEEKATNEALIKNFDEYKGKN
ncbi:hypothetical protein Tco_0707464 [Tanacetum coccineum]|uniref:FAM192A/Fyv6 N-terminal domain-containing protein n=1 Tax=Tanacetum coccineum TaxID=301880 RepID=A0ABQ4YAC4_9ASTR